MAEELQFTIHPDGIIDLEVNGVQGRLCMEITEQIETLLGNVQERTLCKAYYEIPIKGLINPLIQMRNDREE